MAGKPLPKNAEAISKNTPTKTEYSYFDESGTPIHVARIEFKDKPLIKVFPYAYGQQTGLSMRRISEIELRGWSKMSELPKLIKPTKRVSLGHQRIAPLTRLLYRRYPKLKKVIITKEGGSTRFSETTASFRFSDLDAIGRKIGAEIRNFEVRRNTATINALSDVSDQFQPRVSKLPRGGIANFLSFYDSDGSLSEADVDAILSVLSNVSLGNVKVTENFIETRNQINVAFLDDVIDRFSALMNVKGDNEKDWQRFFAENGWILASVFPYQVILHKKEAYVGGKTIENDQGRLVDFLFQNGFRDNYALLEIKTHNTRLVRTSAYREPGAYALHDECSGAIAQCLDQKNIFLTEMGRNVRILDPKAVLIIGQRSLLTHPQVGAFELARSNLKNVDIVTFDELLEKLIGLRSILRS